MRDCAMYIRGPLTASACETVATVSISSRLFPPGYPVDPVVHFANGAWFLATVRNPKKAACHFFWGKRAEALEKVMWTVVTQTLALTLI